MARVSDGLFPDDVQVGLTIDRYAELLGLDVDAFNGVNRGTYGYDNKCVTIINQSQRDNLAIFLQQAEDKRETWLGFYLSPKWVLAEEQDFTFQNPFMLNKKYLVEIGYPTLTAIQMAVPLALGPADNPIDPVVITVTSSDALAREIEVCYPGEMVRIVPSKVTKSGNTITIHIPRCRLVNPAYNDDRDDPISYFDNTYFLTTVDVYRNWADPSKGAQFVWIDPSCNTTCAVDCQDACAVISGADAYDLSIVHAFPAKHMTTNEWIRSCWKYAYSPSSVRFYYRAGMRHLGNEIYTIRLAHTLMPRPPCSCDVVMQKWEEDNEVLQQYTPYGSKRGAMEAWLNDSGLRMGGGGTFPGMWEAKSRWA